MVLYPGGGDFIFFHDDIFYLSFFQKRMSGQSLVESQDAIKNIIEDDYNNVFQLKKKKKMCSVNLKTVEGNDGNMYLCKYYVFNNILYANCIQLNH